MQAHISPFVLNGDIGRKVTSPFIWSLSLTRQRSQFNKLRFRNICAFPWTHFVGHAAILLAPTAVHRCCTKTNFRKLSAPISIVAPTAFTRKDLQFLLVTARALVNYHPHTCYKQSLSNGTWWSTKNLILALGNFLVRLLLALDLRVRFLIIPVVWMGIVRPGSKYLSSHFVSWECSPVLVRQWICFQQTTSCIQKARQTFVRYPHPSSFKRNLSSTVTIYWVSLVFTIPHGVERIT